MVLTIKINCTCRLKTVKHSSTDFYLFIYKSIILPQNQEIITKKNHGEWYNNIE